MKRGFKLIFQHLFHGKSWSSHTTPFIPSTRRGEKIIRPLEIMHSGPSAYTSKRTGYAPYTPQESPRPVEAFLDFLPGQIK